LTQRLTADAFKNKITFLQIWFSLDEVNWKQLPDQKIAVPDVFKDLEKENNDSQTIASKMEFPTGIFVHESKKSLTLQFNEDGSYTIDGDQYKEETKYARCKDESTATYKWSYLGTWLTFKLVGDDKCGPRRNDMHGITWMTPLQKPHESSQVKRKSTFPQMAEGF